MFYGWILLAGLFVCYSVTNGVILNTLPIFYPELVREFGWNQADVTKPAQMLFLVVALASPFAGTLLDRYSAKRLMLIGGMLILLAFARLARIHSVADMSLAYVLFALGITLAGIIPSMRIITRWFVRTRGLAVGLLLIGSSVGGAIFNPIAQALIVSQGWRDALFTLGCLAAAAILLPIVLLVRDSPESMGQYPDSGRQAFKNDALDAHALNDFAPTPTGPNVPLAEALRTPMFYLLLFITGAMWFCIVGVIQHQALFFKDLQTSSGAAGVLSVFFTCSILGKLIFGWLSDRFSKRNIMLLAILNLLAGALLLYALAAGSSSETLLWLYALVFGIGFSGTFTMIQLIIAEYYAGASYGKILGMVTMVDTLAGVAGIMTLGKMRIASGSYQSAFLVLCVLAALAAVCVLLLRPKAVRQGA